MGEQRVQTKLVLVAKASGKIGKTGRVKKIVGLVISYLFLTVMAAVVVFPFFYMISASFMAESDVVSGRLFPRFEGIFENIANNYTQTASKLNYFRHMGLTLTVAFTTTILQMLTTILAAFAFARLEFRGRDILFMFFLATMMIPGEMLAISNYVTMSNLGLTGLNQTGIQAFVAMVLPLISSVFYIYLLRQNFKQIPNELYLAAKIDGKSDWQFLWNVMVPLAMPTLITIAILSLIGSWNSYVWPHLVVYHDEHTVISVIIRKGALTELGPDGNPIDMLSWQMTASVLTVVPLLALFIIFRKYIMSGTKRAGIKG